MQSTQTDIILTLFSDLEGWGYQYSIRIWVKLKLKWSVSGYFFNPKVTNLSFMMVSIKWIVVFLFARKFWVPLLVSARLNLAHRTDVKDQCGSLITNFTLRPGSRVNITCARKHICIRSFKELLIIVCGSVTSAAHEITYVWVYHRISQFDPSNSSTVWLLGKSQRQLCGSADKETTKVQKAESVKSFSV